MSEPTTDPFRLRVQKAISSLLETVQCGDQPMTGRSFRGRVVYGENDPLPMFSLLEPPIPLDVLMREGDNTHSTGDWELLLQGFVKDDPENPTDPAHVLMAAAKAVLIKEKRRERGRNILGFGGKVVDLRIGQGSVRPPDDLSYRAFFWLPLTIKLLEELENPFA